MANIFEPIKITKNLKSLLTKELHRGPLETTSRSITSRATWNNHAARRPRIGQPWCRNFKKAIAGAYRKLFPVNNKTKIYVKKFPFLCLRATNVNWWLAQSNGDSPIVASSQVSRWKAFKLLFLSMKRVINFTLVHWWKWNATRWTFSASAR